MECREVLCAVGGRCGPIVGASGAGECGENPISGKLMKNVRTKFDSKPVERSDGFGAAVLLRKKMEKRKSKLGKGSAAPASLAC